mmetsp:Transcript_30723/g.67381  ORF Transcript_30723/g.67381 Transcript_30723/m.67381 type:complete len:238 (-) Transcript_30723:60-773(-)
MRFALLVTPLLYAHVQRPAEEKTAVISVPSDAAPPPTMRHNLHWDGPETGDPEELIMQEDQASLLQQMAIQTAANSKAVPQPAKSDPASSRPNPLRVLKIADWSLLVIPESCRLWLGRSYLHLRQTVAAMTWGKLSITIAAVVMCFMAVVGIGWFIHGLNMQRERFEMEQQNEALIAKMSVKVKNASPRKSTTAVNKKRRNSSRVLEVAKETEQAGSQDQPAAPPAEEVPIAAPVEQ